MTFDQIRDLVRKRAAKYARNKGSSGVYCWCEAHNVNRTHLSDFLSGKRKYPGTDVLDALGLEWTITRKRKA